MIASDKIEIRIYRNLQELSDIGPAWDLLAQTMPHKSPLMTYSWLSAFFECCITEKQSWFVIASFRAGQLIAVLPTVVIPYRFLGLHRDYLTTPNDDQTLSIDMVMDSTNIHAQEQLGLAEVMIKKAFEITPRADFFEFYRIDGISTAFKQLHQNKTLSCMQEYCEGGASLDVPADYQHYRSSLKKNFKANLNKAKNKISRHSDVKYLIDNSSSIDISNLDVFADVEHACWKGTEGTSIKSNVKTMEFYRKLSAKLANKGWLRFHLLELEGKAIAANLAIDFMGSTLLWKLGYDEAHRRYSPGGMLMENLIESASNNNNITQIDLMTSQDWYDNWGMQRRPFYNYWLFKPTLIGTSLRLVKALKIRLKEITMLRKIKSALLNRITT
ncbi:MAG: GNAT family N-acetyltransferase [Shewanella psychromarinicola]|uniref:GNAT family N-acetyltransferase n=1 Tax=Shewanella psychromarinicola TaxID=2487742 RepID=UPI0030039273